MRRWSCSVTEISVYSTRTSVTGREAFHITMPTEVQSTSSLKKKQAEDYYCLFFSFLVCIEKMLNFRYSTGRWGGGGGKFKMLIQGAVLFRLKCNHYIKCLRFNQEEWNDLSERKRKNVLQ